MNSKGKFVNIICVRCGNNQIVFGKASTEVKCGKCNKLLAKNRGGKITIKTVVKRVFRR